MTGALFWVPNFKRGPETHVTSRLVGEGHGLAEEVRAGAALGSGALREVPFVQFSTLNTRLEFGPQQLFPFYLVSEKQRDPKKKMNPARSSGREVRMRVPDFVSCSLFLF